jgi:hypothetical protein
MQQSQRRNHHISSLKSLLSNNGIQEINSMQPQISHSLPLKIFVPLLHLLSLPALGNARFSSTLLRILSITEVRRSWMKAHHT